ncbi:glutaredoxin 2 [Sodalis sp. C49]|uniref:glutaredoxin 2 n=1 Tax=Sodalis sp. C49 TaxID=3228929 RepID=UPI00396599CC
MKLYVYDHCPFCVRARMIFGLKNIPCDIVILPNDDETTPIGLIGKKMLPILVTDDGETIDESLDIVRHIDETNAVPYLTRSYNPKIDDWIDNASSLIYKLAVPRWAYSDYPEFKAITSRQYFIDKKQAVFGNFSDLIKQSPALIADINQALVKLDALLVDNQLSDATGSLAEILLFPLLRSLSIVQGIVWPPEVDNWRKRMAMKSAVPLNDPMAL